MILVKGIYHLSRNIKFSQCICNLVSKVLKNKPFLSVHSRSMVQAKDVPGWPRLLDDHVLHYHSVPLYIFSRVQLTADDGRSIYFIISYNRRHGDQELVVLEDGCHWNLVRGFLYRLDGNIFLCWIWFLLFCTGSVSLLLVWNLMSIVPNKFYYHPQTKFGEGNVFTGVCLFTGGGVSIIKCIIG